MGVSGIMPVSLSAFESSEALNNPTDFIIENTEVLISENEKLQLQEASVWIKNGKIFQIGNNLKSNPETEIFSGENHIIMPGLIDSHWHLWTSVLRSMAGANEKEGYFPMTTRYSKVFTPEEMQIASSFAIAEAINSGITTITDFNHNARNPDFVMAGIKAIKESGIRALVEYGGYRDQPEEEATDFGGIREVHQEINAGKYPLVRLGLGSRGVNYPGLKSDWKKARELNLPISIHASSNEKQKGQILQLHEMGLLSDDVNIIHANAITDKEIDLVAETKASITLTPFTEMRIGYGFPQINRLMKGGVNTCIGVDTTALSGNADLFGVMKMLQNLANAYAKSEFNITTSEILKIATTNAGKRLKQKSLGKLKKNAPADVIMLDKTSLNMLTGSREIDKLVEAAQPQNVTMVVVNGKILKSGGKLTIIDTASLKEKARETFQNLQQKV